MVQFIKIYNGDKLYAFLALDSEKEETTVLEKYEDSFLDSILGKTPKYHNILKFISYRVTRRDLYPYDLKRTLGTTYARTFDDNYSIVTFESKYKEPYLVTHV